MQIVLPFLSHEIGAGDMIAKATSAVGIEAAPGCGCHERKIRANRALQFVPRPKAESWTAPPDAPEGWILHRMHTRGDRQAILFHHWDGSAMIWQVDAGAYRHSHRFCRSCKGAMESFEELCQTL